MRREHCPAATGPIDCPHVRGPLPVVRGSHRARGKRTARRSAAHRAGARGLTGFIVPRADRHQNEYVPAREERLAWLTGFTGSAGAAIVLMERAVLFVDGRYTLQAREQVDTAAVRHRAPGRDAAGALDREQSRPAPTARLRSLAAHGRGRGAARQGLRRRRRALGAVEPNLIDAIWSDRPAPPLGAVTCTICASPAKTADRQARRIRAEIAKLRADALVVSDPHAVAWAFNIRGADVAHTPLPLAFAIVPQDGPAVALCRRPQARTTCATALEALADVREPPISCPRSPRSAASRRPCGSTRPPPPTRSPASSPATAARSRAAPIRSR